MFVKQGKNYIAKSFLIPVVCFFCTRTVALSIQSTPTNAIITMEDELMQNSELMNKHELPVVSRRGFAGDDFYQKASKSIPRIGRRSGSESNAACICRSPSDYEENENFDDEAISDADLDQSQLGYGTRKKRFNVVPAEVSVWPWHSDPSFSKRVPIDEKCYFASSKNRNYNANHEICNEDMICCPIKNDSTILKRFISTHQGKQTTTSSPDYKSNRFM